MGTIETGLNLDLNPEVDLLCVGTVRNQGMFTRIVISCRGKRNPKLSVIFSYSGITLLSVDVS